MNFTEAIQLAKAGNEAGYRFLYNSTWQSKYYLALQYMKNETDAQDVIQDSYMKAFANLNHLEKPEAFSSWLGKIVANTAKNQLIKRNPMLFSDIETDDRDEPFENQVEDDHIYSQPELSYTRQETRELAHQMIDSLSDEQRICILMFHIEGESIKDIASALGCSENTVKSRLNYGRKNLKHKAEELQSKGWKLWGLAPIPLLVLLLHQQETAMAADGSLAAANAAAQAEIFQFVRMRVIFAKGTPRPPFQNMGGNAYGNNGTSVIPGNNAGTFTGLSTATDTGMTAGSAGGGFLATMAGKVLIGVISAVVAGAVIGTGIGVFTANVYLDHQNPTTIEESVTDSKETRETFLPESETHSETPATSQTADTLETEADTQSEEAALSPEMARNAMEQYHSVITHADSYDYGELAGTPSGTYRYALVTMTQDYPVPTLLLSQENTMFLYHIRVFQYDHHLDDLIQPEDIFEEGVAGGSRLFLAQEGDGNGLMYTLISGGTGDTEISRITFNTGELTQETQWSGRMDQIPDDITSEEIIWHDISDTSALDDWLSANSNTAGNAGTPSTKPFSESQTMSETVPQETAPTETVLPEDGQRIVFTGTINTYSYDEIVSLQGEPDPNAQWSDHSQTYRIIVLDEPQSMELRTADGYQSSTVRLIDVTQASGLEQYDGQHLTFSIDPASTYWPSDTSLPLGQPRTGDVHVLN